MYSFTNFSTIFLFFLIVVNSVCASGNKLCTFLNNGDATVVVITHENHKLFIKTHTTRTLNTELPFNEIKQHFIEFVSDIQYIPSQVITIETALCTFYLWRDHRGIIIAKLFKPGMTREEARPRVACILTQEEYAAIGALCVTIDSYGSVSIKIRKTW